MSRLDGNSQDKRLVKYIRDDFHGFPERPHYEPKELEMQFERLVIDFLRTKYGKVEFPFKTDDITLLIERDVLDLDQYADLTPYGDDVEGMTQFKRDAKPDVFISKNVHRHENRLRTTLAHEYGHVILHSYLFKLGQRRLRLGLNQSASAIYCKRGTMLGAKKVDWMEWQAGFASGVVLMPKTYVHTVVAPIRQRLGVFGAAEQGTDAGHLMIRAVMNSFMVSREAAIVRLKVLNMLGSMPEQRSLFS